VNDYSDWREECPTFAFPSSPATAVPTVCCASFGQHGCMRNPGHYYTEGGSLDGCYLKVEAAIDDHAGYVAAAAAVSILILVTLATDVMRGSAT